MVLGQQLKYLENTALQHHPTLYLPPLTPTLNIIVLGPKYNTNTISPPPYKTIRLLWY